MSEPMVSFCNLDDVDWICPCGSCHTTPGMGDGLWFYAHIPHTDGTYVDTITADGERACGPQKTKRRKLGRYDAQGCFLGPG